MVEESHGGAALETAALVALIHEQAAAEAEEVLAHARERAQRLAAAASAQVAALEEAARREGQGRGGRRAATLLAAVDAETFRQVLWDREALITQVIDAARHRLARLSDLPQAPEILAALVREALLPLPAGLVTVHMPADYEALLGAATRRDLAAERSPVRFAAAPVPGGGVIAASADGRVRFDNSFAARIQRRLDRLRRVAADVLLADASGAQGQQ
jgi:vacuolar-type H+-ATPase subunit E/Vma4